MKKYIISALALLFSFNVKAIEFRPYVSGKINANFTKYDTKLSFDPDDSESNTSIKIDDTVFGGVIAVGLFNTDTSLPLRAEFEFSILSKVKETLNDIIELGAEAKLNTYYLNLYYDFYNFQDIGFVPYVNLGLGAATADVSVKVLGEKIADEKKTSFSWQIGAGSYYKINDNLFADLGLKYSQTSFSDLDLDADIIALSLGLRYNF